MSIKSILAAAVVGVLSASAFGQQQDPATAAPEAIPAVAPQGRVIIDGAYTTAAGAQPTYSIIYVADPSLVGKNVSVTIKDTIKVPNETPDPKTGQVRKGATKDQVKFHVIGLQLQQSSRQLLSFPELQAKNSELEIAFSQDGEAKTVLSNTIRLFPRGGGWQAVDPNEVAKAVAALPAKATASPAKPRKLLIYTWTGGFYHDSIPLGARTFQLMGQKTGAWQGVISNDKFMFEPETLKQFDGVMMVSTTGELFAAKDATDQRLRQSYVDFIANGGGWSGSHAATDCSYQWKDYGEISGGFFQGHPFGNIIVRNEDPQSPINAAFKGEGFKYSDEMYTFKTPYSREKLRILLSIDISTMKDDEKKPGFKQGENRPDHDYAISWIHEYGKGHSFYCSFGHGHHVFWTPTVLQHFQDGIQYSFGDIKADATPSAKIAK